MSHIIRWEQASWDDIPQEVRDLLVEVQSLVDTSMEGMEHFEMTLVRTDCLNDVKKALLPMSIRYRLSSNQAS